MLIELKLSTYEKWVHVGCYGVDPLVIEGEYTQLEFNKDSFLLRAVFTLGPVLILVLGSSYRTSLTEIYMELFH